MDINVFRSLKKLEDQIEKLENRIERMSNDVFTRKYIDDNEFSFIMYPKSPLEKRIDELEQKLESLAKMMGYQFDYEYKEAGYVATKKEEEDERYL